MHFITKHAQELKAVDDSSSTLKFIKHSQIDDYLIDPIKELYQKSVLSLAPNFSLELLNEWADIDHSFVTSMMLEYFSFYSFYNTAEELIGIAGFPKKGFLRIFYFAPEAQRQGFGTKCLQFIEQDDNANDRGAIGLRAHKIAQGFYLKNGYEAIDKATFELSNFSISVSIMMKKVQ